MIISHKVVTPSSYIDECCALQWQWEPTIHKQRLQGPGTVSCSWKAATEPRIPAGTLKKLRKWRQDPQGPTWRCPASFPLIATVHLMASRAGIIKVLAVLSFLQHTGLKAFQFLFPQGFYEGRLLLVIHVWAKMSPPQGDLAWLLAA